MAWRERRQLRVTSASVTGRRDGTGTPRSGRGHASPPGAPGSGRGRSAAQLLPSWSCPGVWSFQGPLLCPFVLSLDLHSHHHAPETTPQPRWTRRFFIFKKPTNNSFECALNFCWRANYPSKACLKEKKAYPMTPMFKLQSGFFPRRELSHVLSDALSCFCFFVSPFSPFLCHPHPSK